jgi:hypothetical protein
MARYRIICTTQQPSQLPNDRAHVVAVGAITPGSTTSTYSKYWQLSEVLLAMTTGDEFYTFGEQSGKTASVEKYTCPWCGKTHIKSSPDAVKDNNLDNLPRC